MSTITTRKSLAAILREASQQFHSVNPMHIEDAQFSGQKATEARYLIFELMEKAGYKHQEIADHFKIKDRANVCKALAKLDAWKAYPDIAATSRRLEMQILK